MKDNFASDRNENIDPERCKIRCYICSRPDEDFGFLHDNVRIHLEAGVTRAINSLNNRERQYREKYGKAIELL